MRSGSDHGGLYLQQVTLRAADLRPVADKCRSSPACVRGKYTRELTLIELGIVVVVGLIFFAAMITVVE